jgi:hypothetical protein
VTRLRRGADAVRAASPGSCVMDMYATTGQKGPWFRSDGVLWRRGGRPVMVPPDQQLCGMAGATVACVGCAIEIEERGVCMRNRGGLAAAVLGALLVGGCAVRVGAGAGEYVTMALQAEQATPAEAAAQIQASTAQIVLLSAAADSAWFRTVAEQTGYVLSGPGRADERGFGFLTPPTLEILGDTSLALPVATGGAVHMHDALYRLDRQRMLDLMYIWLEDGIDIREATRTVLEYIATDVGADVSLLLAVEAPTPAVSDSVALLLRALYPTAWDCTDAGRAGQPAAQLGVRLFYGPTARVRCRQATRIAGLGSPVVAYLFIGR